MSANEKKFVLMKGDNLKCVIVGYHLMAFAPLMHQKEKIRPLFTNSKQRNPQSKQIATAKHFKLTFKSILSRSLLQIYQLKANLNAFS